MASTWGNSWLTSWGTSWNRSTTQTPTVSRTGAGNAKRKQRKRMERLQLEALVQQKREAVEALAVEQVQAEAAVVAARRPKPYAKAVVKVTEVLAKTEVAKAEYDAIERYLAHQRWIDEDDQDIMQIMMLH